MKYRNQILVFVSAMLLGICNFAVAADDEAADAKQQAKLEAEYRQALEKVETQRQAADAAMQKAQEQLRIAAEQKNAAIKQSYAEQAAQKAELAAMAEELNRARQQLSETSREIAHVNREIARERSGSQSTSFLFSTSDRPVIGVILGDDTDIGVEVLGVSPNGPSERAGIKQGDVIIALGGRVLASVDETGDLKNGLRVALDDVEAAEPVIISIERGSETIDLTVVPEVREPLAWQSVSRFPNAPSSPGSPDQLVRIEQLVVPEIDTEALTAQIDKIRADIDTRRVIIEARSDDSGIEDIAFEYEFHDMSEIGDIALHEANFWFGMPLTAGLKLAELDAGLGEYFKTDRGVLVLKAKDDNNLQLQSGDVVLNVGDTEVNSPAEFMRALRELDSGQELVLDIKRDRKNKSLKSTMPERKTSFLAPNVNSKHTITVTKSHK